MTVATFIGIMMIMTAMVGLGMTAVALVGSAMAASAKTKPVIDGDCRTVLPARRRVRHVTRKPLRPDRFRHAPSATLREIVR